MNKPITQLEHKLMAECVVAGVNTSIDDRWEQGVPHHPRADTQARQIVEMKLPEIRIAAL